MELLFLLCSPLVCDMFLQQSLSNHVALANSLLRKWLLFWQNIINIIFSNRKCLLFLIYKKCWLSSLIELFLIEFCRIYRICRVLKFFHYKMSMNWMTKNCNSRISSLKNQCANHYTIKLSVITIILKMKMTKNGILQIL